MNRDDLCSEAVPSFPASYTMTFCGRTPTCALMAAIVRFATSS